MWVHKAWLTVRVLGGGGPGQSSGRPGKLFHFKTETAQIQVGSKVLVQDFFY